MSVEWREKRSGTAVIAFIPRSKGPAFMPGLSVARTWFSAFIPSRRLSKESFLDRARAVAIDSSRHGAEWE